MIFEMETVLFLRFAVLVLRDPKEVLHYHVTESNCDQESEGTDKGNYQILMDAVDKANTMTLTHQTAVREPWNCYCSGTEGVNAELCIGRPSYHVEPVISCRSWICEATSSGEVPWPLLLSVVSVFQGDQLCRYYGVVDR